MKRRRSDLITVAVLIVAALAIVGYWYLFHVRPSQEEKRQTDKLDCQIDETATGDDLDC